jgi:hypothetical protein
MKRRKNPRNNKPQKQNQKSRQSLNPSQFNLQPMTKRRKNLIGGRRSMATITNLWRKGR